MAGTGTFFFLRDDVLGTSAIATNDVTFLRVIRLIQNLLHIVFHHDGFFWCKILRLLTFSVPKS